MGDKGHEGNAEPKDFLNNICDPTTNSVFTGDGNSWPPFGTMTQGKIKQHKQPVCHWTTHKNARAKGDLVVPRTQEHRELFAVVNMTVIAKMFLTMCIANNIIDAIMDEQGYYNPQALSHLDKKWVKQLVSAIHMPGR